jgi:RNA polymerase sigma-70 factor (ECF subfamily)
MAQRAGWLMAGISAIKDTVLIYAAWHLKCDHTDGELNRGVVRSYYRKVRVADRYSDEELLARHQAGNTGAFDELVHRYAPELYRFLARFTGNPSAAEDVLQETLLQAHQSAERFDVTRRLRPWLFTIAANKARDWLRSQRRRTEVSLDAEVGGDSDESISFAEIFEGREALPEDMIGVAEQREMVRRVVEQLPTGLRQVLVLGYFQQLPYKEIAQIVGVPVGTVKSRLHTALKRFAILWYEQVDKQMHVERPRRLVRDEE